MSAPAPGDQVDGLLPQHRRPVAAEPRAIARLLVLWAVALTLTVALPAATASAAPTAASSHAPEHSQDPLELTATTLVTPRSAQARRARVRARDVAPPRPARRHRAPRDASAHEVRSRGSSGWRADTPERAPPTLI